MTQPVVISVEGRTEGAQVSFADLSNAIAKSAKAADSAKDDLAGISVSQQKAAQSADELVESINKVISGLRYEKVAQMAAKEVLEKAATARRLAAFEVQNEIKKAARAQVQIEKDALAVARELSKEKLQIERERLREVKRLADEGTKLDRERAKLEVFLLRENEKAKKAIEREAEAASRSKQRAAEQALRKEAALQKEAAKAEMDRAREQRALNAINQAATGIQSSLNRQLEEGARRSGEWARMLGKGALAVVGLASVEQAFQTVYAKTLDALRVYAERSSEASAVTTDLRERLDQLKYSFGEAVAGGNNLEATHAALATAIEQGTIFVKENDEAIGKMARGSMLAMVKALQIANFWTGAFETQWKLTKATIALATTVSLAFIDTLVILGRTLASSVGGGIDAVQQKLAGLGATIARAAGQNDLATYFEQQSAAAGRSLDENIAQAATNIEVYQERIRGSLRDTRENFTEVADSVKAVADRMNQLNQIELAIADQSRIAMDTARNAAENVREADTGRGRRDVGAAVGSAESRFVDKAALSAKMEAARKAEEQAEFFAMNEVKREQIYQAQKLKGIEAIRNAEIEAQRAVDAEKQRIIERDAARRAVMQSGVDSLTSGFRDSLESIFAGGDKDIAPWKRFLAAGLNAAATVAMAQAGLYIATPGMQLAGVGLLVAASAAFAVAGKLGASGGGTRSVARSGGTSVVDNSTRQSAFTLNYYGGERSDAEGVVHAIRRASQLGMISLEGA